MIAEYIWSNSWPQDVCGDRTALKAQDLISDSLACLDAFQNEDLIRLVTRPSSFLENRKAFAYSCYTTALLRHHSNNCSNQPHPSKTNTSFIDNMSF